MFQRLLNAIMAEAGPALAVLIVTTINKAVSEIAELIDGKTDHSVSVAAAEEPLSLSLETSPPDAESERGQ